SAAAEGFRTLRTNLSFTTVQGDRPLHTLLLSSAFNSEDKSIAVANLAVTFAQAGQRTILVDADLRRPSQHTIWGLNNERGLSTLMSDAALMSEPPLQASGVDNLQILTSGSLPTVSADVLSHPRLKE